ncbi:zinc finger, CCHC-type containing protein [Tanacetum coccineum]
MGILYKSMEVQNKLGSSNLVLVLKQESMEYMMKNVFGLRWNCRELKGIVKLRFFRLVTKYCSGSKTWSTQQCMKSMVAKHLGVAGIHQQNGLVDETNVTLFAKVRCFLIQSGLSKVFWAEDTTRSTYLVNRSPSSMIGFKKPINMLGFFSWLASIKQGMLEPGKVRCIFLGYYKSIVGNKLWRLDDVTSKVVLYRNIEPLGDHTFEVEPQENVDQGDGLQEVQTQDLMNYQLARDRDQHLARELFGYKEDSNEVAFAVAAVEKIYAHESLTFNDTGACEVISKWKAGLKEDMMFGQMCMCSATVAGKAVITTMTITRSIHQVLQREVGTDFVGGTLHTVVRG